MKRHAEWERVTLVAGLLLALTPGRAAAYVGPGGGLALLSTALAMLAAFSVSAVVVLTWPIRAMRRWLRRRRGKDAADDGGGAAEHSAEQR
jgi:hypothetical protein